MNLNFLLATDACDASSSSCGDSVHPLTYEPSAFAVVIPGSPVSQKGFAEFERMPVGTTGHVCEQSLECYPPSVTRDSNTRPSNHERGGYDAGGPLQAWPKSLTSSQLASEYCAHPNRISTHSQLSRTPEPRQKVTAFHHDHQTSSRQDLSILKTPKASIPIRKHGKDKERSSKNHRCFCGRAFNKREHLKRHNLLVHQEFRPFTCEDCDLHFGTKQNFQVHLSTRKHRQRVLFQGPTSKGNSAEATGKVCESSSNFSPPCRDQSIHQ